MSTEPANTEGGVSLFGCAFGMLLIAWSVWFAGLIYENRIAARFARPTEVSDSLAQGSYIAERLLPFDCVTVVADFISMLMCGLVLETARSGGFRVLAVGTLAFLSMCFHGLILLVHFIMAG
jgi:hypothetical protein